MKASKKKWVKQWEGKLTMTPHSLRVMYTQQQLWCCCGDSDIVICDTRSLSREIRSVQLGGINDVAEMINGNAIVASDKGRFLVNCAIGNDFFVEVLVM